MLGEQQVPKKELWMLKISALMGHVSIHERARHGLDLYRKGGVEPKTLHQVW